MTKLCNSEVHYLVASGCKKVNSSKNSRIKYEMMGETQPDMESFEVVGVIYYFRHKLNPICKLNLILQHSIAVISVKFNPICKLNLILQHNIAVIYVQFKMFLKENLSKASTICKGTLEMAWRGVANWHGVLPMPAGGAVA